MSKKLVVIGLSVVSAAMVSLPAAASGQSWHLSQTASFFLTGSGGKITSPSTTFECTSVTGVGSFSTTTGGNLSLAYHGCLAPLGLTCTTPGQKVGTIVFSYSFDAVMVTSTFSTKDPGLLLTPAGSSEPTFGEKLATELNCFGFGQKVFGKGLLVRIHSPASPCSANSSTWALNAESSAQGVQKDQLYTGTEYGLRTNGNASHPTMAIDSTTTLHLSASRTLTCT
jgi:hypothetical protein